jgi:hypothetical protein
MLTARNTVNKKGNNQSLTCFIDAVSSGLSQTLLTVYVTVKL